MSLSFPISFFSGLSAPAISVFWWSALRGFCLNWHTKTVPAEPQTQGISSMTIAATHRMMVESALTYVTVMLPRTFFYLSCLLFLFSASKTGPCSDNRDFWCRQPNLPLSIITFSSWQNILRASAHKRMLTCVSPVLSGCVLPTRVRKLNMKFFLELFSALPWKILE